MHFELYHLNVLPNCFARVRMRTQVLMVPALLVYDSVILQQVSISSFQDLLGIHWIYSCFGDAPRGLRIPGCHCIRDCVQTTILESTLPRSMRHNSLCTACRSRNFASQFISTNSSDKKYLLSALNRLRSPRAVHGPFAQSSRMAVQITTHP